MDNLSPEALAIIVSFLDPLDLVQYVTVSRRWRFAVERHTFRSIRLKSTDLERFSNMFGDSHSHRRAALARLSYHAILPTYSDRHCAKFETKKDKVLNNEAFTAALHGLFLILHSWGETSPRPIWLTLTAYSPMDSLCRKDIRLHRDLYSVGKRHDLFEHRYKNSVLQLLEKPDVLPTVSRISRFDVPIDIPRSIEGASIAAIAAKLTGLKTVKWTLNDNGTNVPGTRQQHRYDFAQAITTLPPSLKSFSLEFLHNEPHNHSFNQPSALHPDFPKTDYLSLALHRLSLSANLTHLILSGPIVVSPNLFWPDDDSGATNPPFWPSLQFFEVSANMPTPSGDWYYTRADNNTEEARFEDRYFFSEEDDASVHSSDSDNSEVPDQYYYPRERLCEHPPRRICPVTFTPLLLAIARAAKRMPRLQRMWLNMNEASLSMIHVTYLAPGVNGDIGFDRSGEDVMKKRWYVHVGKQAEWVLPQEVKEAWEDGLIRVVEF